jgi:hypothetical protein
MKLEDVIMNNLIAESELTDQTCMLNHNDNIDRQAVDFLCHQMGYQLPDDDYEVDSELRIPICEECAAGLTSGEWILFYCVSCMESQWLKKELAKMNYQEGTNIIALKTCPKCHNELLD